MDSPTSPVITISGRHFMQNGHRFIIRGVVYQRSLRDGKPSDPLADVHIADVHRDICAFKDLRLNALFVYQIDPDLNHDESMHALADAGIYVMALVGDHKNGKVINRMQPRQSYNDQVQSHFQSATACLSKYPNTLGVCVSSNLINGASGRHELVIETYEVLSQAIQELKYYMRNQHAEKGQRILPVGIAESNWSLTHTKTFEYLTTGSRPTPESNPINPDAGLDFYCINHYAALEPPETEQGQSQNLPWNMIHTLPQLTNPSNTIPVLLSEYSSSNTPPGPRSFQETAYLYSNHPPTQGTSTTMLDILSGGFVYEFFNHANNYGLVKVQKDDTKLLEKLPDYETLKQQIDKALDHL